MFKRKANDSSAEVLLSESSQLIERIEKGDFSARLDTAAFSSSQTIEAVAQMNEALQKMQDGFSDKSHSSWLMGYGRHRWRPGQSKE